MESEEPSIEQWLALHADLMHKEVALAEVARQVAQGRTAAGDLENMNTLVAAVRELLNAMLDRVLQAMRNQAQHERFGASALRIPLAAGHQRTHDDAKQGAQDKERSCPLQGGDGFA
jgi:hypothetical protein